MEMGASEEQIVKKKKADKRSDLVLLDLSKIRLCPRFKEKTSPEVLHLHVESND